MKKLLILTSFFGLLLAACWFTACQKDTLTSVTPTTNQQATDLTNSGASNEDLQVTDRANGNSKIFPPSAHPYGLSYADWTKVWLEQFLSYDCSNVPWVHPENVLFYTSGPVYILAGISEIGGSANITIPHGKALLFPLMNVWANYPCPDPTWEPPTGTSVEDWLIGVIQDALSNVSVPSLSVTVDGDDVSNLGAYKFVTNMFNCPANPELASCLDACITGSPQPNVMGGYYVMLKPLSKGQHAVHYHVEIPAWGAVQDATYNITVN